MASRTCSCKFKEQMIAEMLSMRGQSDDNAEWIDLLFSSSGDSDQPALCCLLTFLFYYGYCKECTLSLSEQARAILSPLFAANEQA